MSCSSKAKICAVAVISMSSLAGCVTRPQHLYHWGGYQTQVYGHFKGDKDPAQQIQALEQEREAARSLGKPLPPGFQAHLAMLYGKTGRSDRMAENLEAEKAQFPESAAFMDFLLKNLTR